MLSFLVKKLVFMILITIVSSIELELSSANNLQACTVLISSFDPINVELKFPSLPSKLIGQTFGIRLMKLTDNVVSSFQQISDNLTYRNSYELDNVPYQLCVSFNTVHSLQSVKPIYVGFSAVEDFERLIGRVEIPAQLASEENLKRIYHIGSKLNEVSAVISGHQFRERILEDEIVSRNIHKEKRIILLSVIEVMIIALCGVYQIFALRKFLIEKNLY